MRELRWYALRQSAGSTHIEAVAAHRGMDEQYHAFREELIPAVWWDGTTRVTQPSVTRQAAFQEPGGILADWSDIKIQMKVL